MKNYQRGDVVMMNLPPVLKETHVQIGSRPWVIVQNDLGNLHSPTTLVIPLSAKRKRMDLPTHVPVNGFGLIPSSTALCEQIRVVDMSAIWRYICTLPPEVMAEIDNGLRCALFN